MIFKCFSILHLNYYSFGSAIRSITILIINHFFLEKTTVVTTANTEVLDEQPTKSQQDGQQHLSGMGQQGNKGPEHGGDTSGTQGKNQKNQGEGSSNQDQPEKGQQQQQSSGQNDRDKSPQEDTSLRMSDEEVEKLIDQVVESERKRWDSKLSEATEHAREWEQKYNQAKEDLSKNLTPKTATIGKYRGHTPTSAETDTSNFASFMTS